MKWKFYVFFLVFVLAACQSAPTAVVESIETSPSLEANALPTSTTIPTVTLAPTSTIVPTATISPKILEEGAGPL